MTDPTTLDYAPLLPSDHITRRLRQAALLNAVCGPIMALQWPATFAGLYMWLRAMNRRTVAPMSWTDFNHVFPHLLDSPTPFLLYALAGVAAVTSAIAIGRRRWRPFSVVAGFAMCLAFPFGTIAGLPTAIVLLRRASAAAYGTRLEGNPS